MLRVTAHTTVQTIATFLHPVTKAPFSPASGAVGRVLSPSGIVTSYVATNIQAGVFAFDHLVDVAGEWAFRIDGIGTPITGDEFVLQVRESRFG